MSNLRSALGAPELVPGGSAGYLLDVGPRLSTHSRSCGWPRRCAAPRNAGGRGGGACGCASRPWRCSVASATERGRRRVAGAAPLPARGDPAAASPRIASRPESTSATARSWSASWRAWSPCTRCARTSGRLLITVLYRAGRQADALAAYRRLHRRLTRSWASNPAPSCACSNERSCGRTRALAALRPGGSCRARAAPRGTCPRWRRPWSAGADLADGRRWLADHRLVTLVGPAGVGKTRLAVEVAPPGRGPLGRRWLVRLDRPRQRSVSLAQHRSGAGRAAARAEAKVLDRLHAATCCSCSTAASTSPTAAVLVEPPPGSSPGGAGARDQPGRAGGRGEVVHPLAPLRDCRLRRAVHPARRQHRASFRVDASQHPAVEAVCRSLDGLPLAIELAAARQRRCRCRRSPAASTTGSRCSATPQRGTSAPAPLRAAIAWSYDLLFPDDQRGLWALACFADGAPLGGQSSRSSPRSASPWRRRWTSSAGSPTARCWTSRSARAARCATACSTASGSSASSGCARQAAAEVARGRRTRRGSRMRPPELPVACAAPARPSTCPSSGSSGPTSTPRSLGAAARSGPGLADRERLWAGPGPCSASGPTVRGGMRDAVTTAGLRAAARDRRQRTAARRRGWRRPAATSTRRPQTSTQGCASPTTSCAVWAELYLAFIRSQQGRGQDALDLLASCRAEFHQLGAGRGRRGPAGCWPPGPTSSSATPARGSSGM